MNQIFRRLGIHHDSRRSKSALAREWVAETQKSEEEAAARIKETYGPDYKENYPGYGGKDEATKANDAAGVKGGSTRTGGLNDERGL